MHEVDPRSASVLQALLDGDHGVCPVAPDHMNQIGL
jgi:hypothetical protein